MNEVTRAIYTILSIELPGISPEDVNDGNCEWFACRVAELVPEARVVSDDYILHGEPGGSHSFVHYRGMFYDSETPQGATDWGSLPFFVRSRGLAWHTRKLKEGGLSH